MMFSATRRIEIEFGDCDPAGIVYFPNYLRFFDDATAHLVSAALGMKKRQWVALHGIAGIPVVRISTEFSAPCRYGDAVEIESQITTIGRTSFGVRHRLSNGGVPAVSGEETRVWIAADGEMLRPTAIPDAVRRALGGGDA
jgi:4-hydroxybenzoyl-CoA thioesterase